MELGGHSVEMGYGWSFSANPIFAPRKYPAQTSAGATIIREAVAGDPVHRKTFFLCVRGNCVTARRAT